MGTLKTLWSMTKYDDKNRALLLCCPSGKDGQLTQVHEEIPGKLRGIPRNDWLVNSYCAKIRNVKADFPGGPVVGTLPWNAGDTGSIPGLGGSHMPRGS